MHIRRTLAAVLCLSFVLAGCKAKEALDAAAISKDLQKKGTTDLMKQVADDSYDPPADGKLTEGQIRMYMKVREEEKKIAQVAREEMKQHAQKAEKSGDKSIAGMIAGFKTLGSAADVLTADLRAAKQLGYNSQEYLWVKEKVLEASGAAMADQWSQTLRTQMQTALAETRKQMEQADNAEMKKMYQEMLAGYQKSIDEMEQNANADPAVNHNRRLVGQFENELNALAAEIAKWTGEDEQKNVQQWQQDLDKAKADAKK